MELRTGKRMALPALILAAGTLWAGSPEGRPFAKEASNLIRRVAIRATDGQRSADALVDLAIRFDTFPLLTHKTRITMLKEDVVQMQEIVLKLQANRGGMEDWQAAVVDRIAPRCQSLRKDLDAALLLLERSSRPMFAPEYRSLAGDIRDHLTGIVRTSEAFLSWAEREAQKP